VNLPSNVSRERLEAFVNKLSTQVSLLAFEMTQMRSHTNPSDVRTMNQCCFVHVSSPADATAPGAPTRIVISKSIEADVLSHPTQAFTEEDVFVVHCSPQSVFRVRPAMRCFSTLSGQFHITSKLLHRR
jgi:ribosome assembly protein 4